MSIPAGREYKYEELLDRMYSLLVANNPELAGDRKRFLMKPPQVVREGSKRVVIINFGDICKTLNRSQVRAAVAQGSTRSVPESQKVHLSKFPKGMSKEVSFCLLTVPPGIAYCGAEDADPRPPNVWPAT